jgi:phosphomannomutase/phosphoglucomutase
LDKRFLHDAKFDLFKAYDIHGIVGKTLDSGVARQIDEAFGTAVCVKDERGVVIGCYGRLSGPELSAELASDPNVLASAS